MVVSGHARGPGPTVGATWGQASSSLTAGLQIAGSDGAHRRPGPHLARAGARARRRPRPPTGAPAPPCAGGAARACWRPPGSLPRPTCPPRGQLIGCHHATRQNGQHVCESRCTVALRRMLSLQDGSQLCINTGMCRCPPPAHAHSSHSTWPCTSAAPPAELTHVSMCCARNAGERAHMSSALRKPSLGHARGCTRASASAAARADSPSLFIRYAVTTCGATACARVENWTPLAAGREPQEQPAPSRCVTRRPRSAPGRARRRAAPRARMPRLPAGAAGCPARWRGVPSQARAPAAGEERHLRQQARPAPPRGCLAATRPAL